ncbi:cell adhesion molecule 4-like [Pygocentrus nattereri]|uniref:Sc:d0202 n=1 Tax=Pygocentrus nattereri TaxID=42514 RepID=A0AAR2J0B9_PYGNA|nr:cell adhesion molecule 4-like [Pygocentrus nattereri]
MLLSALRLACLSTCFLLLTADMDPIVLTPPRVVVAYEAPASANCSTNLTHLGMGWEAPLGPVDMNDDVNQLTWKVDSLTEWNIKPFCFVNVNPSYQAKKILEVIVYKVPDSVSIRLNDMGQVTEGRTYELLCDIKSIAPLKNLVVKWYKGKTVINSDLSNETDTTPKNKLAKLSISPNRRDNGAQYSCEAQLELGADGPQPPPTKKSEPLSVNVYYSPKFSRSVETLNQTNKEITLDCTVEANPPPEYTWSTPTQDEKSNKAVLSVPALRSGTYNCTASNKYGSSVKQFIIVQKSRDRTTFWAILGSGLALAFVLIVGYVISRSVSSNSVV